MRKQAMGNIVCHGTAQREFYKKAGKGLREVTQVL